MSPARVQPYLTKTGKKRWRVEYRLGGRATKNQHAGSFPSLRLAEVRKRAVEMELAAGRDPRLTVLAFPESMPEVTFAMAAEQWQRSRFDITDATRGVHRKALAHVLAKFAERIPEEIQPRVVSEWVGVLSLSLAPGTVQKILGVARMVADHHGLEPNPFRDRRVKLPRNVRDEIEPPEAEAVEAVVLACAPRYRLPLVVLDATGMRVGELESLTWGDLDYTLNLTLGPSSSGRWRVARQREKAARGRWVPVPEDVFAAVDALVPREDRDLEGRVFGWVDQAALRREIARGAKATGTPLWSPHDLRHRRISLWHRDGESWAQIGEWAGQRDLATTANRYTHVVVGREIDRGRLLAKSSHRDASVAHWSDGIPEIPHD